ncbi:proline-rich receptor-like protein kinase PERK2 [Senna tora]|uniref:Proline-rich receptor-like protein kinase PERK2 n=1 Tax=Senna tora TaxID=362788 RepID=A0A834X836_9FABA|nr:proline-rich receptor-like protein kinase PERK2 [Senna tora]
MASTQNYYDHYIPYFPQPPPHNNHPIPPPKVAPPRRSPLAVPPPSHPLTPLHNTPSPPKVPPPFHPVISSPPPFPVPATPPAHPSHPPPAPTVKPPPHPFLPPPPSPPSGHHSSTVIVVKKKVQKSEHVHVDEHVKVEEAIISGPHGEELKVLSIEEDVHIQQEVDKKSTIEGIHKQLAEGNLPKDLINSKASTSGSNDQHHKA